MTISQSCLLTLFVLGACSACSDATPSPRTPALPPDLRVLTYNVNFGLAGDAEGVAAIADQRADVIFLQETNEDWEHAFVGKLGEQYPHYKFTHPHDWPAGGMGVLSRLPIVSIDELPSDGGVFFGWRVVLESTKGKIQVLAVHLRPPMSDSGSWVVGYFSTRGNREREIAAHYAALDHRLPTLVVGDFNEEADGLALGYLFDRHFADAVGDQLGGKRTWEWPVGSFKLRFQLDHVLHDQRFAVIGAKIVEAGRSDHKPVWADLRVLD